MRDLGSIVGFLYLICGSARFGTAFPQPALHNRLTESIFSAWFDKQMSVNWAAILVAGVADWVLGAIWFTVFRNQWRAGIRMPADELQAYMAHPNFWPYLIALLCSLVMAYMIALIVAGAAARGLFRGITAGLLVGLAAGAAMATEMVFEVRAGPFVLIAAAYPLVGCILMGVIIGAWKRKPATQSRTAAVTK